MARGDVSGKRAARPLRPSGRATPLSDLFSRGLSDALVERFQLAIVGHRDDFRHEQPKLKEAGAHRAEMLDPGPHERHLGVSREDQDHVV